MYTILTNDPGALAAYHAANNAGLGFDPRNGGLCPREADTINIHIDEEGDLILVGNAHGAWAVGGVAAVDVLAKVTDEDRRPANWGRYHPEVLVGERLRAYEAALARAYALGTGEAQDIAFLAVYNKITDYLSEIRDIVIGKQAEEAEEQAEYARLGDTPEEFDGFDWNDDGY